MDTSLSAEHNATIFRVEEGQVEKVLLSCEISGSQGSDYEQYHILGCDAMQFICMLDLLFNPEDRGNMFL
jgi:hypothetical protein